MGFLIDQDETFMGRAPAYLLADVADVGVSVGAAGAGAALGGTALGGTVFAGAVATTSTTLTVSPSARKPAPAATTRAEASRPLVISTRLPMRRPVVTLTSLTLESVPTRSTHGGDIQFSGL